MTSRLWAALLCIAACGDPASELDAHGDARPGDAGPADTSGEAGEDAARDAADPRTPAQTPARRRS